jgi:hypothetical protein
MKRFFILPKSPAPGRPKAGDAPSGGRLRHAADGGLS